MHRNTSDNELGVHVYTCVCVTGDSFVFPMNQLVLKLVRYCTTTVNSHTYTHTAPSPADLHLFHHPPRDHRPITSRCHLQRV